MKQRLVAFLFFLVSTFTYGQLNTFTLQVTPTGETCTGNGVLTFMVSNTTPGASIVYTIYRLPDITTPVAVTGSTSITGLVAGNYRVIATQSLGAQSNTQQQDVTILNQIAAFLYNLTSQRVICGNDGKITVSVTQGTAVNYEIIAGPMTVPLQTSNVFTGLVAGLYQVRVFNTCGDGIVRDVLVESSNPNINILEISSGNFTCSTIGITAEIESGTTTLQNIIAYPLQVQCTVFPPSGAPIVVNQTFANGSLITNQLGLQIPFFYDQSYTYNFSITDACGNVYQQNNNVIHRQLGLSVSEVLREGCVKKMTVVPTDFVAPFTVNFVSAPAGFNPSAFNANHPGPFTETAEYTSTTNYPDGTYVIQITDACGRTLTKNHVVGEIPLTFTVTEHAAGCGKYMSIRVTDPVSFTVEFLSAPAGFNPAMYNALHPGPFYLQADYYNATNAYPEGTYVIKVTDECGRTLTKTITTVPLSLPLSTNLLPGCAIGTGSLQMEMASLFQSVTILAAPAALGQPLPYDVSSNIKTDAHYFSMNSLPAGTYIFRLVDTCNRTRIDAVTINGYQVTSNIVTVTENCSSFNVYLNHVSNANAPSSYYWLQKYNAGMGTWGHPQTGFSGGSSANLANALSLNNLATNFNLSYYGKFRVVHTFDVYANGGENVISKCEEVLQEFEYTMGPKIRNIYSYSCSNSLFDVIIDGVGFIPLIYRITTKDGLPFAIDNGNSALFSGLGQGVYNFQIEDACGNILNRVYDISSPISFTIQPNNLCDGQPGSLFVPNFPFLSYEWWKDNNTATILSTTNTLDFNPLNAATHFGVYHVRITNPSDPNSCLNIVLDFTISSDLSNPEAGTGTTTLFCGNPNTVNLFNYLSGSYSANGLWEELSDSGMLINHFWDATSVPPGVYSFKYTVSGLCNFNDEAIVTFTVSPVPLSPEASADPVVCEGETLELFASDVPGATYQWTGPNGFVSTDQNPILTNVTEANQGTYSVISILDGCQSTPDSVEVTVGELPYFSTTNTCDGSQTILSAEMLNPNFDLDTVSYTWSYPDGTTVSTNPINVTGGMTGTYTLTITTAEGCSYTGPVDVNCTSCGIPRGVSANNDGSNDEFDLSCLEGIVNVKIFNRFGVNVYELDNYVNEWKGQDFKGRLLPQATYYYHIKFENGESKTGWVYLNY